MSRSTSASLTAGGNNASTTYSGTISGSGGFNKAGSGTLLLTGTSTYTGVTNIDGGTFEVDGAITSSSSVNVNAGSTLTGVGTVDPSTVTIGSGSSFVPGKAGAPGTSMTIAGNLAFQSGALYVVYLNQTTSTFANVTGTAALAGTVQANFSPGSVAAKQYTILQSAGLNGTAFTGVAAPPNFTGTLSYSADDVFLKVSAALGLGTALNQNQQSAASAINAFFNGGGALPPGFINLFGQTGNGLAATLTRLDGENATGAEHGAFDLTNEFLSLMLDPFVYGRGGAASGGGPLGFAPDQQASFPPRCGARLCGPAQGAAASNLSTSAGRYGARASAAAARPTAIRRSAQTTSRRRPTALPPAPTIMSIRILFWALRRPGPVPTGVWRSRSAPGGAMHSRRACTAPDISGRHM